MSDVSRTASEASASPSYVHLRVEDDVNSHEDIMPTVVSAETPTATNNMNEVLEQDVDTNFVNVKILDEEWSRRLQDGGCAFSELKKNIQEIKDPWLRSGRSADILF